MSLICFIIWIVFACAVGTAASRHYQRSGFGWGVLAVLISPLLAWLLLLLLGRLPAPQQLQPQPVVNWKAIDWTTGEVAKPRPIVVQPAPVEPMNKTSAIIAVSLLAFLGVVFVIAMVSQ
jgi:hypothetical protein